MDHHDPRPAPTLDVPEGLAPRLKLTALGRPPLRPLSRRKVVLVGLASAGGLAGVAALAWGWDAARHWLATRPAYRCAFNDIELTPSPPPWIKRGAEQVRTSVRTGSGLPEALDSQAIDLAALRRAFAHHSPWVLDVVEVRRAFPNKLTVALAYREPVVEVVESGERGRLLALLDSDAVVLPLDGTDLAATGPLLRTTVGQVPAGVHEGVAWPSDKEHGGPDSTMAEVSRLAGFVKRRNKALGPQPIPFQQVFADTRHGLFLGASEKRWVRWRPSVGPERSPELSDDQKWDLIAAWLADQKHWPPYRKEHPIYLDFIEGGAQLIQGGSSGGSGAPQSR